MRAATLTDFELTRPRHEVPQLETLSWIASAHAEAEATTHGLDAVERDELAARLRAVLGRCAPGPDRIASRGCSLDEMVRPRWDDGALFDLRRRAQGAGIGARTRVFAELAGAHLEETYAAVEDAPEDLIHVTCTGYASPSAAQRLVARRRWPTRVTHAYHMGCYASMPALRIADGLVQACARAPSRVDIVHTELCSLHLDPTDHRLEQLVIQSLFADGMIRYSLTSATEARGLRLLAMHEVIVPGSEASMSWIVGDHGMVMTLARDVPERIGGALRGFVDELYGRAGRGAADVARSVLAIHPGGPRIIDQICAVLELREPQVAASRGVLRDFGNMSSATLPHVWMRVIADDGVPRGSLVGSLAFGPGLTMCGALFEKV
ncbi:MAG TPA: 3-oxoacyl-[acyl-carrier-protein] synthase III C-terminal domain-containing protein [Kofleriaceae bacterium]|nr:3-oxoacyl-[acyl-carrier-protein] synthase III C-terminal domain-containing protein [Kofleriaceae bacterium]